MPFIKIETSEKLSTENKEKLANGLLKVLTTTTGKPEAYTQSLVVDGLTISFGGTFEKSAFVDVKGLNCFKAEMNKKLSDAICSYLKKEFSYEPARVYINFTDFQPTNWGWNNGTF